MTSDPDYYLDIKGLEESSHTEQPDTLAKRRWIGVLFDCCGIYVRVYRSKDGRSYEGRCPRCLRKVRARVGSGGTSSRFFTAW